MAVETLIIVIVVVVVLLVVLAVVVVPRIRGRAQERKQIQAREHLQEAQRLSARAEADRASAEEQAAQLRRERAEAELRAAEGERDAEERLAEAERQRAEAQRLQEKAGRLDPGLRQNQDDLGGERQVNPQHSRPAGAQYSQQGYADDASRSQDAESSRATDTGAAPRGTDPDAAGSDAERRRQADPEPPR